MRALRRAFSLGDVLVLAASAVLLFTIAVPTTARVRELSKRSVCSVNLAGIGAACKVYAASNTDSWPVPAFRRGAIDNEGIDYLGGSDLYGPPSQPGEVGFDRAWESRSETPFDPYIGSTAVTTTRAYWMLVRSGAATVRQFICPSNSDDTSDPTEQIDLYYDFSGYWNISYGYQVPFGPSGARPREGADVRQAFAADKGPFYTPGYPAEFGDHAGTNGPPIALDDPPRRWRPVNSFNHGGKGNGEGQNVLFADGHTSFVRIPAVGVDDDNIYTLMNNDWGVLPFNRIHGDSPHEGPDPPYPGQNALGTGAGKYSSTDSLIYP